MLSDFDCMAPTEGRKMHSHDRTYLASLAFGDPDKKNPEHDRICRYLAQPATVDKIADWLANLVRYPSQQVIHDDTYEFVGATVPTGSAATESHLTKGFGQYMTTVGFIDVAFAYSRKLNWRKTHQWDNHKRTIVKVPDGTPDVFRDHNDLWKLFAEVKVEKVPHGDIMRQMQLYKSFFNYGPHEYPIEVPRDRPSIPFGVIVAPWDITESEKVEFQKNGFAFLKLGDDYKTWAATDGSSVAKPNFTL